MQSETEVRDSLRNWLAQANRSCSIELSDTTPIIENRVITSLQVMDLILYIEQLRGRRVEMDDLKPGVFRDVNSIYQSFFGASK